MNLLYDSGRKCLDLVSKAAKAQGRVLPGWRKLKYWQRTLRNQERRLSKTLAQGGGNRASRVAKATETYLETARKISAKLDQGKETLSSSGSVKLLAIIELLDQYQALLDKHIDLVRRRLLNGETIPHSEKLFSIFEQHTEWINKGKKHKKVELGKNVLIATDQLHFILHHQLMEGQQDVHLAVPTAREICEKYRQPKLQSISFDRGFYSGPNFENLQAYAHEVILPKKGGKSQEEAQRESHKSFVQLRHQHSAVEANINQLEHNGLNKCPDKGIKAFKRYTAWGVLAYNLHRIGKILMEKQRKKSKKAKAPIIQAA